MLCNLLGFDGMSVLPPEGQLCDGDIVQHDIEGIGSLSQHPPNVSTDNLQGEQSNGVSSKIWLGNKGTTKMLIKSCTEQFGKRGS